VVLRPALTLAQVQHITLLVAVGVARAIESEMEISPQIKWPNDILVHGKKVAGILTELSAELNRIHTVVVGIGVNVNTPASRLPAHATSLAEVLGRKLNRVNLTRALLVKFDEVYQQFLEHGVLPILESWRGYAGFLGRHIRVVVEGRKVEGQAVDIDETGSLLVRTDTGLMESVSAGEVLVVR